MAELKDQLSDGVLRSDCKKRPKISRNILIGRPHAKLKFNLIIKLCNLDFWGVKLLGLFKLSSHSNILRVCKFFLTVQCSQADWFHYFFYNRPSLLFDKTQTKLCNEAEMFYQKYNDLIYQINNNILQHFIPLPYTLWRKEQTNEGLEDERAGQI